MHTPEAAVPLLDSLYSTAIGEQTWQAWLAELGEVLGAAATSVLFREPTTQNTSSELIVGHGYAESAPAEYVAHFAAKDVRVPALNKPPPGKLSRDGVDIPYKVIERSEIQNEFYRPQGLGSGMAFRIETTAGHGLLSAFGGLDARDWKPDAPAVLAAMSPHIGRALAIYRRTAERASVDTTVGSALSRFALPLVVVDRAIKVRWLNAAAEKILSALDSPVRIRNGKLHDAGDQVKALVMRVLTDGATNSAIRVRRADGAAELSLLALRPTVATFGHRATDTVGIILSDRRLRLSLDPTLLREQFGVTIAEAGVATALALGHSVGEIAIRREVSPETVRVQIKALQSKLDCRSQVQLVSLLSGSLAALASSSVDR